MKKRKYSSNKRLLSIVNIGGKVVFVPKEDIESLKLRG